ncbi:hypothetical protein MATL_G00033540 [Megalops atlanticus]|uniref:Sorting nexin-16 n=1 Tax=Megalops atlanticus TaxID=7932 RepID=A0A9D3TGC4_MEGAT|nr:hypothetical protein MATL_G00033540 [Megalops atlanticus]
MATPFVPVAVPMDRGLLGSSRPRTQRTASLGSTSSSSGSSSSRGREGAPTEERACPTPTPPPQCQSPTARARLNGADCSMEYSSRSLSRDEGSPGCGSEERPLTPTVLGYEVMEERAKFTWDRPWVSSQVYKILVRKSQEESWVVFRRYTDFSRLNDKLKEMFPGFRLSLPPKRWFKDNYNTDFLEDRQLGLQVFLQNMVAHKDIANSMAVREFLCLDDPPGPFDSLEESRAFCETLEESNYRLQKELVEKQREISSLRKQLEDKQLYIHILEKRINGALLTPESPCVLSGQCSESSGDVDGDVECSAVEADQEMGEESSSETQSGRHSCWCGPPLSSSPPVIQVPPLSEALPEH